MPPDNGKLARPIACPLGDDAAACLGVLVVVHDQTLRPSPACARDESSPPELHQRLRAVLQESFGRMPLNQIVGESPAIAQVREQVQLARGVDARVLVVGPPGSGREYIARAIHYSGASSSPLAPLACSLLDAELLESTISSFVASCAATADRAASQGCCCWKSTNCRRMPRRRWPES